MAKRNYRAWTPDEESDLEHWVALYSDLTWSERAQRYSIERKPRSAESLRTKFRLLKNNIRRLPHSTHSGQMRPRYSSAKGQRRNQRTAQPDREIRNSPTSSVYSPQGQCSALWANSQQTPTTGWGNDRPSAQASNHHSQTAARWLRPAKARVECENARKALGDLGGSLPDVPDTVPCSCGDSPRNYRHGTILLGPRHHGRYLKSSQPPGPGRKIDQLWQLVYHVAGRVRQ